MVTMRFSVRSLVLLLALSWTGQLACWSVNAAAASSTMQTTVGRRPKVLIELFVMSRCPDARRAEARFDDVFHIVNSIADIRTVYLADEDPPGNITCKHGPEECAGDEQQLCAALYGRMGRRVASPNLGWAFLQCQNANFSEMGSPSLAEACLKVAGFPPPRAALARSCWSGPEGRALLRASAAETSRRGVTKSCTVYIGGEYRCTHDDATWYDCPGGSEVADFVATVCAHYRHLSGRWPASVCGPEPQGEGVAAAGEGEDEAEEVVELA